MNEAYISHHGIIGQRWGVRRYQHKDGSLTKAGAKRYSKDLEKLRSEKNDLKAKVKAAESGTKKINRLKKLESETDELKKKLYSTSGKESEESDDAKRERLLKSGNAKELYENRHLLSTAELNERINRIDTEDRLKSKIVDEQEKTGKKYVSSKLENTKNNIDKATNLFKSIDSAFKSISESSIGNMIAKKLGIEPAKKEFNINDFWKNRNKKTTQEIQDVNKRLTAEDAIAERLNKRAEKAKKERAEADARKQVDEYNQNWYQNDNRQSTTYSKTGRDVTDARTYTRKTNPANTPLLEYVERYEATGRDVIGTGTSRFTGWKRNTSSDIVVDYGQSQINVLLGLEDQSNRK